LHAVTKYFMFSLKNASTTFQTLNNTLHQIKGLNFSNSSNFQDPRWIGINQGLNNTSVSLNKTQSSLDSMDAIIESQDLLDFEELAELNQLLENLKDFTQSASERVDIVDQYVSALNNTLQSVWYFSLGSFSLNETMTEAIGTGTFEPQTAILNFTLCQTKANQTYDELTNIRGHLLNDSAVDNWRDLVRGNITDDNTNSIYMNAERCLDLISDIEAALISLVEAQNNFQDFLENMELLDDNWDVFTL
ncbi:MAG: hypothetical protein ACFFC6_07985, partial [Promethearchaeota archaeon]